MTEDVLKTGATRPLAEPLAIALRAYAASANDPETERQPERPSRWTLIFDTETTVDAAQRLRFGVYQVREGEQLRRHGIFYDPDALSTEELDILEYWARREGLEFLNRVEFLEGVFYRFGYDRRGLIVGFNLPFDLARIAIAQAPARRRMRGGFSLTMTTNTRRARVQVKHLTARASMIQFALPGEQLTPRGMRKRGLKVNGRRGFFVDVKTLAAALTATSHTLKSLADFLEVAHRKLDTDEHGAPITDAYIEYAIGDVQTTWECYRELMRRYGEHGLTQTPAHRIKSEAGLGKAYLRQMGIRPWRQVQPDFPPGQLGQIFNAYYGGRSEVRLRRVPTEVVYCDFTSMYPTVCTLMGLWRLVIADGMTWADTTEQTRRLIEHVQAADVLRPEFWPPLHTLVQIKPDGDLLPVRARYGDEPQNTIGLNYLSSAQPLWFTLADCIAAKLLTGKAPQIARAITYAPGPVQAGLRPVRVCGLADYPVDPANDDFYRAVIDRRSSLKRESKAAVGEERKRLGAQQFALKILANATSYGIFIQVDMEDAAKPLVVQCFGAGEQPFDVRTSKIERPGEYSHPLLGVLITGAARLMLAMAERLATDAGLDWAMCDTDSIALARPEGMTRVEFRRRAEEVRQQFTRLNPYRVKESLLKIEHATLTPDGSQSDDDPPLYCYAISAKRYVLYNLDPQGRPVIRKASAHGLGHLRPPYDGENLAIGIPEPSFDLDEIGVHRWQYDLWYQIIIAALGEKPDQPNFDFHPALHEPAISRYAATTPELLNWFAKFNKGKPYSGQVKPFNFMTALHARKIHGEPLDPSGHPKRRRGLLRIQPIAPYCRTPNAAADLAFDRATGNAVPRKALQSYLQAIAQYHLHPEAKFTNADYTDRGRTERRHILAMQIAYIGKEADKLEEQFFLGADPEAGIDYGVAPRPIEELRKQVQQGIIILGYRRVARSAGMSLRDVSRAAREPERVSSKLLIRLDRVIALMTASGRGS